MINGSKRKEFDELGPKQKKRRIEELVEVNDFVAEKFRMTHDQLIEELKKAHHYEEAKPTEISPADALKLKDQILLSDWAYQQVRNVASTFPSLTKVKAERQHLNNLIKTSLQVVEAEGSVYCSVVKALSLINHIHNSKNYKLTFDHRRNEERDEVLLAMIPSNISHSPNLVFPVAMYVGKEEELLNKAATCLQEINHAIRSYTDIRMMVSTDLKSFWTMTELRFKFATDQFCPYCHCQKCEIEEVFRGTKTPPPRNGNFGMLSIHSTTLFIVSFMQRCE